MLKRIIMCFNQFETLHKKSKRKQIKDHKENKKY